MSSSVENVSIKLKKRIFFSFALLLCIPMFQAFFPFIKEKPLDGIDSAGPFPKITKSSWLNERFQKNFMLAFEQNIGFHNSLVRLHNQINFSIFKTSDAGDVVVGKNGYVFLKPYIEAFTGADFVGKEHIAINVQKIKCVQTELKKRGVDFFVVLAPGKGSFDSEYIPDNFKKEAKPDSTNYRVYKKMFDAFEVNNLDLHSYFLSIKHSETYPLYSTTGVHWTDYGCLLASKKIIHYIEELRKISLPKIKVRSIEMNSYTGNACNDYDAATLMNIFTTIPQPKVAIAKLQYESDSATMKPRFLCISDSYFAGIIKTRIPANVFSDYHYWLYYDAIFPESYVKEKKVSGLDIKKEIEKQDVVCMLATEASLAQFPYGFIDDAYERYAPKDNNYYELKKKEFRLFVATFFVNVENDKIWKAQLVKSAKEKGVPESVEFFNNALWLYTNNQKRINK